MGKTIRLSKFISTKFSAYVNSKQLEQVYKDSRENVVWECGNTQEAINMMNMWKMLLPVTRNIHAGRRIHDSLQNNSN